MQEPRLGDGTELPTGFARKLIRIFIRNALVLERNALTYLAGQEGATLDEASAALAELVALKMIERHVEREPPPPVNEWTPRMPILAGYPRPGEVFCRATYLGARAASLATQLLGGRGGFLLGPERAEEQLLAEVSRYTSSRDGLAVDCPSLPDDEIDRALAELVAQGQLILRASGFYEVHPSGAARAVAATKEIGRIAAGLPPPTPDPRVGRGSMFDQRAFHRLIATAARAEFADGHGAAAEMAACLALANYARSRVDRNKLAARNKGLFDPDGTDLVGALQTPPMLLFDDVTTPTGKSAHEGAFMLFRGIMLAVRNPLAHRVGTADDVVVLERIALVSLMVRLIEQATVVP